MDLGEWLLSFGLEEHMTVSRENRIDLRILPEY
jgi:hypothetical protein